VHRRRHRARGHGDRGRVGGVDLQVGDARAAVPRAGQEARDQRRRDALPAHRLVGDDVEHADDLPFARGLAGADRHAVAQRQHVATVERRVVEALAVRVALRRRRRAQRRDRVDECVDRRVDQLDRRVRGRRQRRAVERERLHERRVERRVAARFQRDFEVRRRAERRDAEQRRQLALGVDALAVRDLLADRQRRAEMRVDAAPALRLARRHAQHPAVVEQLALRLQRVESRLLDAARVDHAAMPSAPCTRTTSAKITSA